MKRRKLSNSGEKELAKMLIELHKLGKISTESLCKELGVDYKKEIKAIKQNRKLK